MGNWDKNSPGYIFFKKATEILFFKRYFILHFCYKTSQGG